jgi:hypothetical protein
MKKIILAFVLISLGFNIKSQDGRTGILQDLERNQTIQQDVKITATLKSASRLFGEKDDLTTVITIIPSGTVVDVVGSDSTYLRVLFEETEGYIFKRHAVIKEKTTANITENKSRGEQVPEAQVQQQQQQVSRFTFLENKYGSNMAARLVSGKIWKGMNAEMVRDSWGKPQKINRVIAGNTIKEEWIYNNTWLYIENDNLVEWGPIRR